MSTHLNKQPKLLRQMLLSALAPAIGLGLPALSHAQTLEEVIVTAQKQEENIQNVPITIAVLNGDELAKSGIDTQRQLAMATPSIAVNVNANFVAPYIRGVGTQYANPGLEPSVATYFNDLYLSRPSAGLLNFNDIERVEVLKGPQGTLYGRNTTGGAIRIITKSPTEEFEAGVGFTLGNYNKRAVDFFVSGPLTSGLTGRLSGQVDKNDGWIENVAGGDDVHDRNLGFLHGKLAWDATEKLTVAVMVDYTRKKDREGVAFQPLYAGAPEQTAAAFPGAIHSNEHDEYSGDFPVKDNEFDAGGVELRADYDLSDDTTLTSITGYRYNKFHGFADLDATSIPLIKADTELERTEDWSQEFQVLYDDGDKINLNTGIFAFYESATDNFGLGGLGIEGSLAAQNPLAPPGAFTNAMIGGDGKVEVTTVAWYGEGSYDITEEWEVMLGLRYTDETKKAENDFYLTAQQADGTPLKPYATVISNPEQEISFEELSPKIQITWRPVYGVMLFASYQEGFKSGGFNMPNPSPGPVAEVEQETLKATELGWKMQFERVRINGAIFHYDLEDLQIQVTGEGGGITSVRNAGTATVDGIESDITFAATEELELGAGFGYQTSEFGSVPNGQYIVPCAEVPAYLATGNFSGSPCASPLGLAELAGQLKGNDLPQSPELTGYVRGAYTQAIGGSGKLVYSVIASYADEFSWTADNLYTEDSKTLVNANVTWTSADEKYNVGVFGTNLTDEEYNTHNAPFAGTGGWKVPGAPRMYGVRVGANIF